MSIGLAVAGRFRSSQVLPYVVAQVLGGVLAALVLYAIASGRPGFTLEGGFAANGYGAHSPGGYSLQAGLLAEIVLTMMFLSSFSARPTIAARAGSPRSPSASG